MKTIKNLINRIKVFFNLSNRPVEEVLKLVANSKHYANGEYRGLSRYMCISLVLAHKNGLISGNELRKADEAIKEYLGCTYESLKLVLKLKGLPDHFEYRKSIYLNWNNRPKLK